METEVIAVLVSVLAIIFAPALGYFAATYSKAGKIDRSEARDLWDEGGKIRDELRADNEKLSNEISKVRGENEELKQQNIQLKEAISELKDEIRVLHWKIERDST